MSPDPNWRPDGPGGLPAPAPGPEFPSAAPGGHGHAVRFYGSDGSLAAAVADFIAPALSAGHAALVFASPELRRALLTALPKRGIDPEAALGDGRLHWHDARAILERILSPAGMPDEDRFMRVIGGLIAKASADRPALRAFAGMSALPWAEGNPAAALELERLWGMLGRTVAFSLLCAYPMRGFRASGFGAGGPEGHAPGGIESYFARVCDAHEWVIPGEPFRSDAPEAERQRQIAGLQVRLAGLEKEGEGNGWTPGDPLSGLPDVLPVLIWSAEPDGRLSFVNRSWLEFAGGDERQHLGRELEEGTHPGDREGFAAAYRRAREGRAPFHAEYRFRRRDGAWRWLLNTASPRVDADGTFLGFAGACVDITDRKAAEERARQARNLESLGRLAGGLAHDFNNLLTAINGYSEISLSMAPEEGPMRGFLEEIRNAGERASELTRQLLAYGRKQVMSAAVFDLNGTLDDMEPVLRRSLGDGIRLVISQQPGLGRVQADPALAQQLILGLSVNARDAMPAGGTLAIETADALALAGPDGGARPYVRLSVSDTGPGMDPEVLARAFEPFFTTKQAGAGGQGRMGAGMGLSSAYGFARQSGGFMTAESEAGRGSVFRLYLPWFEPEPGRDARIGPEPKPRAAVLIAAEGEFLRQYLSSTLRAEGYPVSGWEEGDSAAAGGAGEAADGPALLIAEDPLGQARASALAERVKVRNPSLRVLTIPASAEASDLPLPRGGDAMLPFSLPLTRAELLGRVREALEPGRTERADPGSRPESGSPAQAG
jgi:PAS domain S-box-containing protein